MVPETTEQEDEAELKSCFVKNPFQDSGQVLPDESADAISTSTVCTNDEQEMKNQDEASN